MGGAEHFLIDTSAASRILRPEPFAVWGEVLLQGRVSMCESTMIEMLYSARSADDRKAMKTSMAELYAWRPMPESAWRDAEALQDVLTGAGVHRCAGIADLMAAVTARYHRLTVLHYDRDFETIAQHTELKTRWLAEPGSLD